jgi:acyl carrier protein
MYGPTETTVWSSVYRVEGGESTVPIGRPIANTRFYVLDARGEPLPVGLPGELCIGGPGVVRGYLRRPELTAARFPADPFTANAKRDVGERIYRTGDLVRYREDGVVEFLGRLDDQVKIRGHRIELGEIEAVLARHPLVSEVAVAVREDGPGDLRLVAGVVPKARTTPDLSALRLFLEERLPDFMVPGAIVAVDRLPRTPNGKLDRRALAKVEVTRQETSAAFVAPRTPIEDAVAGIWAKVLGIDRVGAHDNFFRLGGNSLATIQVASQIGQDFGVEIPIRVIFGAPTVAELATRVEQRLLDQAEGSRVAQLMREIEQLSDEAAGQLAAKELAVRRGQS